MFIALEGPDACGKTTLCSVLVKRLRATAYSTPPKKYLKKREGIDKNASAKEHYLFYRNGIYDASDEIKGMLKNGGKIISDRYWLTTYTYHQIMNVVISPKDFSSIVQPDLTVILAVNHNIQIKRFSHRGISAGDNRLLDKQQEIARAFYQNALTFGIPFIVVNTQHFSPEQCANIIVASITSLEN